MAIRPVNEETKRLPGRPPKAKIEVETEEFPSHEDQLATAEAGDLHEDEPEAEEPIKAAPVPSWERRGYCGKFKKVMVFKHPDQTDWVELKLGDFPKVTFARGAQVVLPIEYFNVLKDTYVMMPKHNLNMNHQDLAAGRHAYEELESRFTFADLGDVPASAYEKQMAEKGKVAPWHAK